MLETYLNNPWGDDSQDEVQPNVGKDTPESCDKKHSQVFDLARLTIRNYWHTQTNYHKHIKGRTAHYGAWAKLPSIEVVSTHLYKGSRNRL